MKKIILILFVSMFALANNANAQIGNAINQLEKTGEKILTDTKKASTGTLLNAMDQSLKTRYNLDGVKSQIMGDVLKIRVADADFAKLTNGAKTSQAAQIMSTANTLVKNNGLNLQGLGVKNVVVEMVKNMTATEIIQTLKKPL